MLEQSLHIKPLKRKMILFALQAFSLELSGKHVRVFCDYTTAFDYVNEMRDIKLAVCNNILIQVWAWCVANGAWVTCSHLPGKENTAADTMSHIINDRHEWQLNVHTFRQFCGIFGTTVIILFEFRLFNQMSLFCS